MDRERSPIENEYVTNPGILDMELFLDRESIEEEAYQLLSNREAIENVAVKFQERQDNARTALMEALTASGHLSEIKLTGSLQEINDQVLCRLLNGWNNDLPLHEQNRRFSELCNELIIQKVGNAIAEGILPTSTEVLEISDYPEPLRGTRIGYRHENKKGMVRSTGFRRNVDGSYTRIIEQVSRSNGTHQSTYRFFDDCGIKMPDGEPDLVALSRPVMYTRQDFVEGVVDVIKMLDEYTGQNVRYGDTAPRIASHPEYYMLRTESKRREADIEKYTDDLAQLERQLDDMFSDGRVSMDEKIRIFTGEVDRILSAICTLEPSYASDTFGMQAEALFAEAAVMAASGDINGAHDLIAANGHMKGEVTFCGVTISVDKAQAEGLEVNSFGQLLEKGQENWRWKHGKCRVPNCPSPRPTKIGPCSVCRTCQRYSDKGVNLMKLYKPKRARHTKPKKSLWAIAA